jgi:hypothetical protein
MGFFIGFVEKLLANSISNFLLKKLYLFNVYIKINCLMSNDEKASYVKLLLNDPILKWILRFIGAVLLVFISVFTIRAAMGKHVNLLGIEMNIPEHNQAGSIPDTVYIPANNSIVKQGVAKNSTSPSSLRFIKNEIKGKDQLAKRDTVKSQQTTVNGNNAHVISGSYNQVGVNGDVTVTQQPELNEWYKQFFARHIERVRRDSAITSNNIIMSLGSGSNAGKLVQQLKEHLNENGFEVDIASSLEPLSGIRVGSGLFFDNKTKVVWISVGNIN